MAIKKYSLGLKLIALFKFIRGVGLLVLALSLYCSAGGCFNIDQFRLNQWGDNDFESTLALFTNWLDEFNQIGIIGLASIALLFSLVRFLEALGLYFDKTWAEGMVIVTSLISFLILGSQLLVRFDLVLMILLIINIGVLAYLSMVLLYKRRRTRDQ